MYAKILIPTELVNIAAILITTDPDTYPDVSRALISFGWTTHGAPFTENPVGNITINEQGLTITVDEHTLIHDETNPESPQGWWEAIDQSGHKCLVLVTSHDHINIKAPDLHLQIRALLDTDQAVDALLPITH